MKILCSRFPRLADTERVEFFYDLDITQHKMDELFKEWHENKIDTGEFADKYNSLLLREIAMERKYKELYTIPSVSIISSYDDKTGIREFPSHRSAEITLDNTYGILFEDDNGR